MPLTYERLLGAYRTMRLIRGFEEKLIELVNLGKMSGFLHVYSVKRRLPRGCARSSANTITSPPPIAGTDMPSPKVWMRAA